MATTFLEPGGDATFNAAITTNGGLWTVIGGTPAVATDFVHGTHVKSIQYAKSVSTYARTGAAVLADAGSRFSVYIYLNALPSGSGPRVIGAFTSGAGGCPNIHITSSGVLQIWNSFNGAQIGTDGATLATGQWYRISLAYTITSTTVNRFELFVNGKSSISITNATLDQIGTSIFYVGNLDGDAGLDMRASDIYVDNLNTLKDTGDIWVTAKRPNANGTSVQFATQIGAGGSGYGSGHSPQVNERALSVTNGWSISTTTIKTEEYSIESNSTGDIDISKGTTLDYIGWIYAQVDSTANSPVHHIIVGGTATAKTMATTAAMYTQVKGSGTYPAGSTDIGMDATYTTTPHLTSLFECGIMVAFIPAATISVTESSAITDTPTLVIANTINVSDSTAVSDTPTIRLFSNINVTDSSAVSDTPTINKLSYINVSESSTVSDTITIQTVYLINVSESSTVGDAITLRLFSNISVNDSTTIQEYITMGSVIVFDNTANFNSLITSISGSYTTAGTNRGLVAIIYSASSLFDISNPTYGGVVMQNADSVQLPAGYSGFVAAYYMTNPTVGSNTFAVARTGTGTLFRAVVASYYNVEQDNDTDGTSTATVLLSNTITGTVANAFDNDWTIFGVVSGLAGTLSAGSGSFARTSVSPLSLFDSNGSVGALGSHSMTVTSSAPTDGMAGVILGINPYIFFSTQPYFLEGEDVFVEESVTISITTFMVSVSDSRAVTDTPTVYITTLFLSVSDSSAVSDSPSISLGTGTSVSDSTTVNDVITLYITVLFTSVNDSTTVSDTITMSESVLALGYSFVVWID